MYNFYSFENCVTCSLEINKDKDHYCFYIPPYTLPFIFQCLSLLLLLFSFFFFFLMYMCVRPKLS